MQTGDPPDALAPAGTGIPAIPAAVPAADQTAGVVAAAVELMAHFTPECRPTDGFVVPAPLAEARLKHGHKSGIVPAAKSSLVSTVKRSKLGVTTEKAHLQLEQDSQPFFPIDATLDLCVLLRSRWLRNHSTAAPAIHVLFIVTLQHVIACTREQLRDGALTEDEQQRLQADLAAIPATGVPDVEDDELLSVLAPLCVRYVKRTLEPFAAAGIVRLLAVLDSGVAFGKRHIHEARHSLSTMYNTLLRPGSVNQPVGIDVLLRCCSVVPRIACGLAALFSVMLGPGFATLLSVEAEDACAAALLSSTRDGDAVALARAHARLVIGITSVRRGLATVLDLAAATAPATPAIGDSAGVAHVPAVTAAPPGLSGLSRVSVRDCA